jgi:O-antigen ligase
MMAVALVWSMSRSGIAAGTLGCLIVAGAAAKRMGTTRAAFACGAIVLTLFVALSWKGADQLAAWYGKTNTLEWRFRLWNDTVPALEDFWITGAGLNTYGQVMLVYPQTDAGVHAQQAHNDYLQLAVEGGALVCIPALILILALGRLIVRRLREPQDETTWWIRLGAVAGLCGMALQSFTEFSLQIPGVALLFATCVAIAIHEPAPLVTRKVTRSRRTEQRELVTSI